MDASADIGTRCKETSATALDAVAISLLSCRKRMKQSKYNIVLKTKQKEYLYNTFSLALAEVESDVVRSLENDGVIDDELAKSLYEAGFLIEDDEDELEELIIKNRLSRFSGKVLGLVIAPTLSCNLNCIYCFEEKKNINMQVEIINKIEEFVRKKICDERISEVNITWYGGEPLLCYDTIREISERIQKMCVEYDIKYTASIITNGLLLNKEMAHEMKNKLGIQTAQITVDGTKEVHESRRCSRDGKETFKALLKNIDECADIIDINLRINVDKENHDNIICLLDELVSSYKWLDKVSINFARVKGNRGVEYTQEEFADVEFEFGNYLFSKGIRNLDDYEVCRSDSACASVGLNYYVVDPEGYLYTCWNDIGIKELSIGSFDNIDEYNSNYRKWLLQDYSEECKQCVYLPLCQGGCPYEIIRKGKNSCCHHALNVRRYLMEKIKLYEERL